MLQKVEEKRERKEKQQNRLWREKKWERKEERKKGRSRAGSAPGTTYWKGLELQTVTAGKFMVLKPMERETLTSQLR